jgi:hypothetical protein
MICPINVFYKKFVAVLGFFNIFLETKRRISKLKDLGILATLRLCQAESG